MGLCLAFELHSSICFLFISVMFTLVLIEVMVFNCVGYFLFSDNINGISSETAEALDKRIEKDSEPNISDQRNVI